MNKIKLYLLVTSFVSLNSMESEEERKAIEVRDKIVKLRRDECKANICNCVATCGLASYSLVSILPILDSSDPMNQSRCMAYQLTVTALCARIIWDAFQDATFAGKAREKLESDHADILSRLQRRQEELGQARVNTNRRYHEQ